MSNPIENMLQTGYFTTSRAKHGHSASVDSPLRPVRLSTPPEPPISRLAPRYYDDIPYRRSSNPPPPTVEDEVDSLAKEFGSCLKPVADEEPQARGEVDQMPVMEEVFEYNPERRFVIVPGATPSSAPESETERRFVIVPGATPSSVPGSEAEDKASKDKDKFRQKKKAPISTSSSPEAQNRRKINEAENVKSNRLSASIPQLERRGSRQDLPRLETDVNENRTPSHHRSKSAVNAPRPEFTQTSRKYGEEYLSPQVTKHGSIGRDKTYNGYGKPPTHSSASLGEASESRRDEDRYHKRSATATMEGRPNSSFEPLSRPMSHDRVNGSRPPDSNRPLRDDLLRDTYASHKPSVNETLRAPSPSKFKDQNSPRNETFSSSYRRGSPVIIDDDDHASVASSRRGGTSGRNSRSPSRVPTMPISSANSLGLPEDWVPNRRMSTTFPLNQEKKLQGDRTPPVINLPYPDDDDAIVAWPEESAGIEAARQSRADTASPVLMPPIPRIDDDHVAPDEKIIKSPTYKEPSVTTKAWQPPPFDPNKSAVRPDQTVGFYRRYSETRGHDEQSDFPNIPECKRKEPVAGKMDWLTLPRTEFNICPDCYGHVFADTQYRTHFHPVLRPTGNAIACDFGSSPWYQIAWLLTLKHKVPDLQLFHHLARVMFDSRDYPCPVERKVTRVWYTVKDPYTRRPVPEFAVCYQCAKTVETLFPNLTGVFIPLDPRNEPSRNSCSLQYTPQRKQFVLFFDAFETTSDKSYVTNRKVDVGDLSMMLTRLSTLNECREDRRVSEGYWYVMEYLPDFTVCGECYEDVVRPQRAEDNVIAQNFYLKPTKLPIATCQLYSARMRDVFKRACRNNDPQYLEEKARERLKIEKDVHSKFLSLVRDGRNTAWTDEQIDKLSREWKRWE
ncbi:hypothetical protein TGAM01_v200595 [Trichoderma gamsii]|uniref:Ser/arg-related nuclear matrix protein n=1 Tax=Trichoderma gamsii TaxID=398673 RepID=A0A2P5A0S5_9HYPO|nr:hypothetical protein TGAM01_v200595 [Trichoderma gamsii]PON30155.1 hypothetical protein TGAM01_v200595 [Trichoderma gamsii]